ncbi:MAG: TetR/AcrR family transcriptional regulator [Sphingobacteriales bacterium]|nr:MAG: TetR/AcrR family transcriptional regulator [Sphingobacteriales bacterium]
MDTKTEILLLADQLMRERSFNAFSFSDIARQLNIRNASVHYHFPTKTALGVAIVQEHRRRLDELVAKTAHKSPPEKLKAFLNIYSVAQAEQRTCVVGSLASDLFTVEPEIQDALRDFVTAVLEWVTCMLREGRASGDFHFSTDERTKALLITTNMLAALQLTRLTGKQDFKRIKDSIVNDLIQPS